MSGLGGWPATLPPVANEEPTKNPWVGRVVYGGVGVAAIAVAFGVYLAWDSAPGALDGARARTDGQVLEVINGGSVPWAQVEVTLNDDYDCGVLATLAEGETQTIKLTDCADRAGRRFTPQTLKPRTVALRVLTGGRFYETRLSF